MAVIYTIVISKTVQKYAVQFSFRCTRDLKAVILFTFFSLIQNWLK